MTQIPTLYNDVTTPIPALPMDEIAADAMRLPAPSERQIQPIHRQSTLDLCLQPDNANEFRWRVVFIYFSLFLVTGAFTILWLLFHR